MIGGKNMKYISEIECKSIILDQEKTWKAHLKTFIDYGSYYEAIIEARGSSLTILVGRTEHYNWIAIPYLDVATTLASFDDLFWNEERLSSLINPIDSASIVCTISFINQYKDLLTSKILTK